jgi:hypothetical protein
MSLTKFPNGVSSFGIPVLGGPTLPLTTGTYSFVDSTTGSDGNSGRDPGNPLATIDAAINKCTASKADVIVVMPGHAETIAAVTTLVPDVEGITIIGLGNGDNRPTLTYSATGSEIEIGADNIVIDNLRFVAGISAVATGIDVNANFCEIKNCEFYYGGTTTYDFVQAIDIDGYDDCKVINCTFIAEDATAGADQHIRMDDAHRTQIVGCKMFGDCADAAILEEGAACEDIFIAHNYIYNDDTASAVNCINIEDASTGLIAYNSCTGLYGTDPDTLIDPGSCGCIENYCSNAINESGTIVPVTISA